jgi:hypothetical protein
MIANEKPDDLLRALASLTSPAPAAARDARIRARCHAALTRRKPRSWQARGPSWRRLRPSWPRVFRPAPDALVDALAAVTVVYGIVVAAEGLRLAGLF